MNTQDLNFVIDLVRERSGLSLSLDKGSVIDGRLLSVARKWEIKSVDDLVARLRGGSDVLVTEAVVEAMMATDSCFFRDLKPFDQFRNQALPYLLSARETKRSLRIWCAACGSGQEPYSLAMILAEEQAKLSGWNVEILATDLSGEMLAKARTGIYSQSEIQRGLPIQFLVKYFRQQQGRWSVDAGIRDRVRFRALNLLDDPAELGIFDVIFCRNVLLHIATELRTSLLSRLSGQLSEDGFLYLGNAEKDLRIGDKLVPLPQNDGIYQPLRA